MLGTTQDDDKMLPWELVEVIMCIADELSSGAGKSIPSGGGTDLNESLGGETNSTTLALQ